MCYLQATRDAAGNACRELIFPFDILANAAALVEHVLHPVNIMIATAEVTHFVMVQVRRRLEPARLRAELLQAGAEVQRSHVACAL